MLNSMERPDIVSFEYITIRRGLMKLCGLSDSTEEEFSRYKNNYFPYYSVASIYLWKTSFE